MRQDHKLRAVSLIFAGAVLLGSCTSPTSTTSDVEAVGVITVGSTDDLGYNQAVKLGTEAIARALPNVRVRIRENVAEDDSAIAAMEDLIAEGANVIFATSFGHLDSAMTVAGRHPEVVVVHQGGFAPDETLPNFGTYFGVHSEVMYLAGIAAGSTTETGKLGFVAAFPIPATFSNVNAFTLGAQSVRPDVTTEVMFTGSWCEPTTQLEMAANLVSDGVDVLAQHQDCTGPILEFAEASGLHAVGYHSDGSEVAPTAWLGGAVWFWDYIYIDIVELALAGEFSGSQYDGRFVGSLATGDGPLVLAEPGPAVTETTLELMMAAEDRFISGASPFIGPIDDASGAGRVAIGRSLNQMEIDSLDWFVEGVVVAS